MATNKTETPSNRGGHRDNAGRRPKSKGGKKYSIGIRLPLDLHTFMKMQPNKTEFFEEVLRFYIEQKGIQL